MRPTRYSRAVARQRKKKPATWAQVAIANVGFREGLRAFQFTMQWGLSTSFLGHHLSRYLLGE